MFALLTERLPVLKHPHKKHHSREAWILTCVHSCFRSSFAQHVPCRHVNVPQTRQTEGSSGMLSHLVHFRFR